MREPLIPWYTMWSYHITQLLAKRDDPTRRLTPGELAQIEAALEDMRWKATEEPRRRTSARQMSDGIDHGAGQAPLCFCLCSVCTEHERHGLDALQHRVHGDLHGPPCPPSREDAAHLPRVRAGSPRETRAAERWRVGRPVPSLILALA